MQAPEWPIEVMNSVRFSTSLIYRQLWYWLDCLLLKWVPSSLPTMQLGPDGSSQNPTMVSCWLLHAEMLIQNETLKVQFFTWDARHKDMSWWKHLATEAPHLAALGFTQIWLPPPNKAMEQVRVSSSDDKFTILTYYDCCRRAVDTMLMTWYDIP
jgi:hypothetical protein